MNTSLRLVIAPLALAFATTGFAAESGHVDFGRLTEPEKGEWVDITLGKGMLKLASMITRARNSEAADLIAGLSRVKVNVVGLDDGNRVQTTGRIESIREELVREGWEQIVAVRGEKQEDVAIFLKHHEGEIIDGLVVTVVDERKKQAVLVNIVGHIKAGQLGLLGEHLEIPQLGNSGRAGKS